MISLKIVRLDPYHPVLGLLVPQVAQRLLDNTKQLGLEDEDSEATIHNTLSRLWSNDPTVLMLACIDSAGHVKGHAVASIEGNNAFLLQPRIDEPTDRDTIGDLIAIVDEWVKDYNKQVAELGRTIGGLTLIAKRSDPKWAKKYGFETKYYVMVRDLKGE